MLLHGLLYVVEGCVRAVLRTNWLLLVHHTLWTVLIVIATDGEGVFAIKLDLMLDWMVCFEAPLFFTLILARLHAPVRLVQATLLGGLAVYVLSRLMQTAMLAYYFSETYGRMQRAGQQQVYW